MKKFISYFVAGITIVTFLMPATTFAMMQNGDKIQNEDGGKMMEKKKNVEKTGEITKIDTTSLQMKDKKENIWTVNFDENTVLRRKFGGESNTTEFSVGDRIVVKGKKSLTTEYTIDAKAIRNMSIEKKNGVFNGKVKNLSGSTFDIETVGRDTQKVTVSDETKFIKVSVEGKNEGSLADLQNDQTVVVKGLWDRKLKTVTEVKTVMIKVEKSGQSE